METQPTNSRSMADSIDQAMTVEQQFVSFALAGEKYGIEITKVQEIMGYRGFTKIPNASKYICGVLNLRGAVVPAIDLRAKFNLETKEYDSNTVILIAEVAQRVIGIVVDAVSDVISLKADEVLPKPSFSGGTETDFIMGMGKQDEKFIILLDIEKVLTVENLEEINATVDQNKETLS
jgi:purine-binding chemotaxis protein CheW